MKSKIAVAYQFSQSESSLIESYYTRNDYKWDDKRLMPVKSNIRKYLRYLQHNLCCYCKQELGFDNQQVDIEHIVPKEKYKQFGFEPQNLALSCHACNSCKTDTEVLTNKSVTTYPSSLNAFKIVHPYFDDYEKNITVKYPLFISHTDKGDFTIQTCHLNRLAEVEKRQKEWKYKEKFINSILNSGLCEKNAAEAYKAIKQIIDEDWPE